MEIYHIENQHIDFEKFEQILSSGARVELSESTKKSILNCRAYLDEKVERSEESEDDDY